MVENIRIDESVEVSSAVASIASSTLVDQADVLTDEKKAKNHPQRWSSKFVFDLWVNSNKLI